LVLSLMKVSTIALVDTLTLYRNALKCVRIGRLHFPFETRSINWHAAKSRTNPWDAVSFNARMPGIPH
jgi:hypothetical protein